MPKATLTKLFDPIGTEGSRDPFYGEEDPSLFGIMKSRSNERQSGFCRSGVQLINMGRHLSDKQ
jgi:hypothetical protein